MNINYLLLAIIELIVIFINFIIVIINLFNGLVANVFQLFMMNLSLKMLHSFYYHNYWKVIVLILIICLILQR